jgi:hypothetical protein
MLGLYCRIQRIALALSPESILADKVIIHSIKVQGPEINYEQSMKGNNLSKS